VIPGTPLGVASLLLAIVPGYLTIYFWSRNKTWKGLTNDLHTIIQSVVVSSVIQVALAPVTLWQLYPVRNQLDVHPVRVAAWLFLVLLIVPVVTGTIAARVSDHLLPAGAGRPTSRTGRALEFLIRPNAEPSVWDWIVPNGMLRGKYVIVEFTDGKIVGGTYSLVATAFTSPQQPGIFLNEEWVIDESYNFVGRVPNSNGVVITDFTMVRAIRIMMGEP
jgi:putative flippase GtrA